MLAASSWPEGLMEPWPEVLAFAQLLAPQAEALAAPGPVAALL